MSSQWRQKYNMGIKNSINAKAIIDMRLNGCTFNDIAESLGITKASLYYVFKTHQQENFSNYEPINTKELQLLLDGDSHMSEIADAFQITLKGLLNYISDYQLTHRCTPQLVAEKLKTMNQTELAAFLGMSRSGLIKYIKLNHIES